MSDEKLQVDDYVHYRGQHGKIVERKKSTAVPTVKVYFGTIEPGVAGRDPVPVEHVMAESVVEKCNCENYAHEEDSE